MRARILVVDDDLSFTAGVRKVLHRERFDIICAKTPSEALSVYSKEKMNFDLLMIDFRFENSEITGADLALRIKQMNPYQPIIFMTGFEERDVLVPMLQSGASRNYIAKGDDLDAMISPILKVLAEAGRLLVEQEGNFEDQLKREADIRGLNLVGRSKALHQIVSTIMNVRRYRSRFLIIGDSGSGKELLANAFRIPGKPFVAVDCAQFAEGQEQLMESKLFGHVKGAYTGAHDSRTGALELANGGVLFLDELHHLSLVAQAKLLRTLQEMKYTRLGDTAERSFDATIVAAAKPDIKSMLSQGSFKEDLYFRLAKKVIEIPRLSARRDDIKPLARHFTDLYSHKHGVCRELHPQLLIELEAYSWPGNVRELEGVIENLIMTSPCEIIGPELFRSYMVSRSTSEVATQTPFVDLNHVVASTQTDSIVSTLRVSQTIGETARKLNVARTTLNDRLKKLNIDPFLYLGKQRG